MGETITIATRVDEDSQLYRDFAEYEKDYANKSQAVRAAIRDGMDADKLTRDDLQAALQQSQEEAQIGAWESGVLTSAFVLATIAVAVAVTTILPIVPSFAGIVTASLLLTAAVGLLAAVQRGTVEQIERRFSRQPAAKPFPRIEVAE